MSIRATTVVKKTTRRWQCKYCPALNPSDKKKCAGCGVGRATKRTSLSTRCDTLWAKAVKSKGYCEARGFEIPCGGGLEAAHIVPRRHRSSRWLIENGMSLCSSHHRFYTTRERMWRDFVGGELWDRLWGVANKRWDGVFPLETLRAAERKEAA